MQESMPGAHTQEAGKGGVAVILAGLFTTVLTLFAVYIISANFENVNIMGWYLWYIVPAGAIGVGVLASSGYGIASWISGVKISASLLVAVLGFQIAAYFAGQYIEFSLLDLAYEDGTPVSFIEYFDFTSRMFSWIQDDGSAGTPFGVWGYAFRLLEVAGFAGGSLIIPLALSGKPYCNACQRYMLGSTPILLPASLKVKKIKKSDTVGRRTHDEEQKNAYESGINLTEKLLELTESGDAIKVKDAIADHTGNQKAIGKLPIRISLNLYSCPQCSSGEMALFMVTGQGNNVKTEELQRRALRPNFVAEVIG